MRRTFTIVIILLAVIGGSVFGYRLLGRERSAAAAPNYETYTVSRGDLISTVSATGSIEPEQSVSLAFKAAGRVATVQVREGESVQAGQVLATLETTDLVLALAQAEATLRINLARLEQTRKGAEQSDIDAARAALTAIYLRGRATTRSAPPQPTSSARAPPLNRRRPPTIRSRTCPTSA